MLPSPLLVQLTTSLVVSTLRLAVEFHKNANQSFDGIPFLLISKNRNLSFALSDSIFLVDNLKVADLKGLFTGSDQTVTLNISARCLTEFAFKVFVNEESIVLTSPSLCSAQATNELFIGPDEISDQLFYGCIKDVILGSSNILKKWCRRPERSVKAQKLDDNPQSDSAYKNLGTASSSRIIQPVFLGERLKVEENGSAKVLWKNLYLFPEHRRFQIVNTDVIFEVVDQPEHGKLLIDGTRVTSTFTYDDIIRQRLVYIHDGSESRDDSFDVQVEIKTRFIDFGDLRHNTYTIPVAIEPKNDPPQLMLGSKGALIHAAPNTRLLLTDDYIKAWDVDTETGDVSINMVRRDSVRLTDQRGLTLDKFTAAQLLNGKVYLVLEGEAEEGVVEFQAQDTNNATSPIVKLRVTSAPIEVHLKWNTGLKVPHRSDRLITAPNLTFFSNFPDVTLVYSIVDQPEFGVVECLQPSNQESGDANMEFSLCSSFTQGDIEQFRVRYRHSSETRPQSDSFSFQVQVGDVNSIVHVFHINFIPVSVRVFIQESLLLNNTEHALIQRTNLLATAFPHNFSPDQLIYHIVEPPKFGMLSRKVEENRQRRIGVSSNFTQQHIDENLVSYKLHFVHYSVVNDFFSFRLVTPAVTSELLRFDITYIPGGNSIQLVNRTLIVTEGGIQPVTNNTLWLETADDTNFVFTIAVAPFNGKFILTNDLGAKFFLESGSTFTSFDIIKKRLFYEHAGDESRQDRTFLLAESLYRPNTRIPLWFSVSVIAENDQAPEPADFFPSISGSGAQTVIYLVENGERTLHPSLLAWTDKDTSSSLSFHFIGNFRDFVIFTKENPQFPARNFTQKELDGRKFIVRHLSLKKTANIKYQVSDGKHATPATLTFTASEPFLRLENSKIIVSDFSFGGVVPVFRTNISAQTNLDEDIDLISYEISASAFGKKSAFLKLVHGRLTDVNAFLQKDINENKIFYNVESLLRKIPVKLRIGEMTSEANILIEESPSSEGIQLRYTSEVSTSPSSLIVFDSNILGTKGGANVKYTVVDSPKHGGLVMQMPEGRLRSILPSNIFVSGFKQIDIDEGRVQYLHSGNGTSLEDEISFNVTISFLTMGPFKISIRIIDTVQTTLISTKNLTILAGGNVTLDRSLLRFTIPLSDYSTTEYQIVDMLKFGKIVNIHQDQQPIRSFTHQQLTNGDILYNSDSATPNLDYFSIKACFGTKRSQCSNTIKIYVELKAVNIQGPEISKNEQLNVWNSNSALITNLHLKTQDLDTPVGLLKYLVWQPIGGFVALASNTGTPISTFTQADIDERQVVFVFTGPDYNNVTCGFSFLVSDGLHQTKPEWFTVSRNEKMSITLETNARLNAAPTIPAVVGIDLLRAKIPKATPEQILYTVSRAPIHGEILLNKKKSVRQFTQADINNRLVYYKSNSAKLGGWSQKDYFNFIVSVNSSTNKGLRDEFRFRIQTSFAWIPADELGQFVSTSPVVVGRGGYIALNVSHLNLTNLETLCDDTILVEVYRNPKHGELQFVKDLIQNDVVEEIDWKTTKDRVLKASQLHSGRHLIYQHRNNTETDSEDEIVFYVYAQKEKHKRSSRLRIPLSIHVNHVDGNVKIEKFRTELDIVSGGSTVLQPTEFQVTDMQRPPSEVVYEVQQQGTNGVRFALVGPENAAIEVTRFTQAQINKAHVRLEHTPLSADDRFDVLILSVGNHTRSIVVRLEPLALNLFNHTDITYPQGKTYVLLNRKHLGADSNGDRAKIVYNITKPPENGTFYWVAGEKEASSFTQKNIDDGELLYAQLNLNAFQDTFEFTLGNEEMELLQKTSRIVILPALEPQTLITEALSIKGVSLSHLNASALEGTAPRFLVIVPPKYGRLFLHPNINESVVFFTQSDILENRLFYHAYDVQEHVVDVIELELRGDSVQPARFEWQVDIKPMEKAQVVEPGLRPNLPGPPGPGDVPMAKVTPDLNQHFPVIALLGCVLFTLAILFCRRQSKKKKNVIGDETREIGGIGERELPNLTQAQKTRNDLLDTTVYATVGRNRRVDTAPSSPTSPQTPRKPYTGTTARRVSPPTFETFEVPPPPQGKTTTIRSPSLTYRPTPLTAINPLTRVGSDGPQLRRSTTGSAKLKDSQYWV